MEEARSSVLEVETVPTPVATLDEVTRTKLAKLPKPKVSQKSTGIMSACMEQMTLID